MNSERTQSSGNNRHRSKKHNLRSKLLLFSSPIVSLSPIKEEPGGGGVNSYISQTDTIGILSASCHGAFAASENTDNKKTINPYSV